MGSIEVRNPLLSNKLKRTETRLLIIDDNQIRYNQMTSILQAHEHHVHAMLLDDLNLFEKQLHLIWDLVIFGRAYDLKLEQALTLIHHSNQPDLPLLLLKDDTFKEEQYTTLVRKGVYDIINLDQPEDFYLISLRALAFSRLNQGQQKLLDELETLQTHAQLLVDESNNAVALIQEGIHVQANDEYLKMFGFSTEDDIIGMPILDIIQPKDLNEFKQRLKKANQGQFDLGSILVDCQNTTLNVTNPIKVEFLPSSEDDAVQISIDTGTSSSNTAYDKPSKAIVAATFQQINRALTKEPANVNALVLFSLSACPESIFQLDWQTSRQYFEQIKVFLSEQTNAPVFKFDTGLYLAILQADHLEKLQSKLIALGTLGKTQLLTINDQSYPLNLRIGYTALEGDVKDEAQLEYYVEQAFNAALPQAEKSADISFDGPSLDLPELNLPTLGMPEFSLEQPLSALSTVDTTSAPDIPVIKAQVESPELQLEPAVLKAARRAVDESNIQLKYQQLYDKQDSDLHSYEVTAGFIFENKWQSINTIRQLNDDQELSIKLDRWILVEACKQLHNFITQHPQARLIVNLNKEVLLYDQTLPELAAKLLTIVRSKLTNPIMLQFSEEELSQHQDNARKQILQLRKHGAEISLRSFGESLYSDSILREFEINAIMLHPKLTERLRNDKGMQQLQERIQTFTDIRPDAQIMVRELNDMTAFANAWNIEARFLVGDYFQKKLDQLVTAHDH
jgi:EAL domain-containing protein (putative c-di-GMP-specific phosphodiesterase class I)/PAS domain-containing protein